MLELLEVGIELRKKTNRGTRRKWLLFLRTFTKNLALKTLALEKNKDH